MHMVRQILLSFVFFVLFVVPSSGAPVWLGDLDEALVRAAEGKKRVLLDYYAAWCPPCQEMDKEVWRAGALGAQEGEFVFVHLDGDRLPKSKTYKRYPILGYPTVWILSSDGKAQGRYVGYETKTDFLEFISETVAGKDRSSRLGEKLAQSPEDPSLLLEAFGDALIAGDAKKAARLKAELKSKSAAAAKGPKAEDWEGVYDRALLDESAAALYGEEPDAQRAAALAEAALKELPKSPLAPGFVHLKAKALRGIGKGAEADAAMAKMTAAFPDSASAYWRVLEYARLNSAIRAEAGSALEEGLKKFPKNERFLNQVVLYLRDSDPKRAGMVAGMLKELKPENAYYDDLIN